MIQRAWFRTLLILALLLSLSAPLWSMTVATAQTTPYIVANGAVYVRAGPGTGFWILGTLYTGESVPVQGVSPDGGWWYADTSFGEGWVSAGSVTPVNTAGLGVVNPGVIGTVTSGALHVRYGAGINATVLGTLSRGDQVYVLARNADASWLQIRWGYGTGWVAATYLSVNGTVAQAASGGVPLTSESPYGVVLAAYLNVRTGPGINYEVLGQVSGGDSLNIVGRTADSSWYQIESPFGTGWVYAGYVAARNEYGGSPVTTADAANASITGPTGIINTGALHIRSGPGPQFTSLGTLAGGTETQIVGRNADWSWWLLDTPVGTGWADATYILVRGNTSTVPYAQSGETVDSQLTDSAQAPAAIEAPPQAIVATGALNIRSGPNGTFPKLGSVYAGTRMPIVGQSADHGWWMVDSAFGTGWVSKRYILTSGDTSGIPVRQ